MRDRSTFPLCFLARLEKAVTFHQVKLKGGFHEKDQEVLV